MRLNTNFIDPEQLARIADLELLARTVVEGVMTGIHRGPRTGSSIEFSQYRAYAQGDDPRLIDWKLYGRTDRLHVKQFLEETGLRCTLLLDCSASMDYGSGSVSKFQYARMLCACLAMMLRGQGDAVGLVAYHRELLRHLPPGYNLRKFRELFVALAQLRPEQRTDTPGALRFLGDVLKPRGMIILISDLLHPLTEMIEHLKSLRARRHDLLVFQITDPAERDFPFDHALTFVDAESGGEQFVVPEAVREGYLQNRSRHFETLRREALAAEIDLVEFSVDEPLDHALRHFINCRTKALLATPRRAHA